MAGVRGKRIKAEDLGGDIYSKFATMTTSLDSGDALLVDSSYDERTVPTDSIVIDEVLGLNGIPFGGRVIHIHGKEHGGKSTMCYGIVKAYQKRTRQPAVIFDFEGTTTTPYLKNLGVDVSKEFLAVWKVSDTETAIKKAVEYMEMGVKLFVFDSIPRMKYMYEKKDIRSGAAMKASVGEHARIMTRFFDILLPYAMKHDCLFLMVNQIRARIDSSQEAAMAQKYPSFTNLPYTLPGGNSVRFIPSIMIEVNVAKALRGAVDDPFLMEAEADNNMNKSVRATRVKVRVLKNKVTMASYREYHIYLRTGRGLDDWMSVRELARNYGLIRNKGAKYVVGTDDDIIMTYENKEQAIRDLVYDQNVEILSRLREMVVAAIREDQSGTYNTTLTEGEMILAGHKESGLNMDDFDDRIDTEVELDGDDF